MSGFRLASGGRVDRSTPLAFKFDGRTVSGFKGDTLASALLGEGQMLFGRSFKLHRPRGVVACGPHEPNALCEIAGRPNRPATTIELVEGLEAKSQNRWPSLQTDLLSVFGSFAPMLSAGFYYKTFMWPASFWERFYEPAIRRAAGLGRLGQPDDSLFDSAHAHCDVLVIGSGAAGLAAAHEAATAGSRVILVEQDFELGGRTLLDRKHDAWREETLGRLRLQSNVSLMTRTTLIAAYEHGVFAAIERLQQQGPLRERHWTIRARRTIVATGASERLIAFAGNDRPGVMLAGATLSYLRRQAVACGQRAVLFTNNDEAYETVFALAEAGLNIAAIVDVRGLSNAGRRAQAAGLKVRHGCEVYGTSGRPALTHVHIRRCGDALGFSVEADLLCVSGGFNPNVQILSQTGVGLQWDKRLHAFTAKPHATLQAAGRAAGNGSAPDATPAAAFWEVRSIGKGDKAFVDLQHDVTTNDIRQAAREGFTHVEHLKRYTTHGMATDQGRIGGLVGSAVLAEALGVAVADVGLPKFRPFVTPPSLGALAGAEVGADFKPQRLLPLHEVHERAGAVFVKIGLWLRPLVYSASGDTSWGPVLEEARAVRRSVGITDVSSLGKIDVQGPDAAAFLDRIYANTISTLAVGRARYGLMLREDGIAFDDGTVARFGEQHFVLSTTTQKADDVLAHMEWHHATVWPELDVVITNIGDHWAQFALAGPRSRDVLRQVVSGIDVGNEAFPFMAVAPALVAGIPGRVFRISFSGELAFELAVPARHAEAVWAALLRAGAAHGIRPYGLDALNVLRIEKGHVAGSELNGSTTAADLGLQKMLKKKGDFVGRALAGLAPSRPGGELVGLHPVDPTKRLRGGAHLVAPAGGGKSEGFLTAACMASEGEGWIGLALLSGGHARHGERMLAASPVYGESVEVIVTSPHRLDPENVRVKA